MNHTSQPRTQRIRRPLIIFVFVVLFTIVGIAYFLKTPQYHREMLAFRQVCTGWKEEENAVEGDLLIYDVEHKPTTEIPVNWQDTRALERFCEPYALVKFRPSTLMFSDDNVIQCHRPATPGGALCSWYPICMLKPEKDAISAHVNASGAWEEKHLIGLKRKMREAGDIDQVFMLDAGANQGIYTIWAAILGYRVVSFEANPRLMPLLAKSLSIAGLASRVTMFNNAISHVRGEVKMREEQGNIGASSIEVSTNEGFGAIKQIRLDDALATIVKRHKGMDLGYMKIDIESHEAKFFTGGVSFMQTYYPRAFQIEINTIVAGRTIWDGCDCDAFAYLMERIGYNRSDGFWQQNVTFCQSSGTFGESIFERKPK